ncbi:helix-turn-helix transcriptional regulator [Hoeflea sp. BAL378]|uniref:helix-turn-helix domain-containing protein n=1 Tax=Hoeflea sp. BAL378 TaxID=1547437 RepID=UPI00191C4CAC|nr:helix-turn-helix transcriptional regulator [Hoeflea sp. BAL378]
MTPPSDGLTYAERTCLQLAARGLTLDAIAKQFGDSQDSVETYLASVRTKLMAHTTMEAVARALKLGLIA